jgi:hypothetical protein
LPNSKLKNTPKQPNNALKYPLNAKVLCFYKKERKTLNPCGYCIRRGLVA